MFKETGMKMLIFPCLFPKSLFEAEEKNQKVLPKNVLLLPLRLKNTLKKEIDVDPKAKLEEDWWYVRPVKQLFGILRGLDSSTEICLLINQWANVCVGKCDSFVFENREFLWQKDTPHMPTKTSDEEATKMQEVYAGFC
jgi:hypothetical protein